MARKISGGRQAGRSSRSAAGAAAAAANPPAAKARSADEDRLANFFLGALLALLVVIVFMPVFTAGFIWDDDQLLTASPQVQSPDGWWALWLRPITADYFPLTMTTLWIEYHIGLWKALGPLATLWNVEYLQQHANEGVWSGYHIMNLVFHSVAVILTWQLLKRLRVPGAWVVAAIFAVHPVSVESVAWIAERKNGVSQIFFLLSLIEYVRFQEDAHWKRYLVAVICFALALLAKTSVVMLPVLLLVMAWWRRKELEPMRANYELEKSPLETNALAATCIVGAAIVGGLSVSLVPMLLNGSYVPNTGLVWACVVAGAAVGAGLWYALKQLKVWNGFAGFEVIRMGPFFAVALLLGVVTIYFQYGRAIGGEEIPLGAMWQRACSACFAAGFYLYSALWPFNLVEIYPQWHRAFYMPETFPFPHIEPPAREALPYWEQVIPGLMIAGLLAYCWLRRKETWARTLLAGLGVYILAMLPALGLLKMSYMRLTLVADHFQYISIAAVIALVVAAGYKRAFDPRWLAVAAAGFMLCSYLNWGATLDNHVEQVLWIAGLLALAWGTLARVDPEIWKWLWGGYLAVVLLCSCYMSYWQADIYHSEETLWSATLAKNPYSWQAHNHLGAALYVRGDVKGAFPHFLRATQLKPENPESHNNLGLALSMFGQMDAAIEQYKTAVGIKDDSAMRTNLANAYQQTGQNELAVENYRKAIELNPSNASAYCNLGYTLMQLGHLDDAIQMFMKTVELDPRMPQGRGDLERSLAARGVDTQAQSVSGTYPFDVNLALQLLHAPPPAQ